MEFVLGREYRRAEIHAAFGGQEQSGISTPRGSTLIFVFTGQGGEKHGYRDGPQPNGVFFYSGEGQVGDQKMTAGNLALADAEVSGKSIHLFSQVRKAIVRYEGEARCIGHHSTRGPDRNETDRRIFVFEFELATGEVRSADVPDLGVREGRQRRPRSLAELKALALADAARPRRQPAEGSRRVYERSLAVRDYVLARANGICEGCGDAAPFLRHDGSPYLEPHHILRMADGGPDHIASVAALCPACHRCIHHGQKGHELNRRVAERIAALEAQSDAT